MSSLSFPHSLSARFCTNIDRMRDCDEAKNLVPHLIQEMGSVYKISKILFGASLMALAAATPAMAQSSGSILNSRHIGAGLVIMGAGYGIGKLASSALES